MNSSLQKIGRRVHTKKRARRHWKSMGPEPNVIWLSCKSRRAFTSCPWTRIPTSSPSRAFWPTKFRCRNLVGQKALLGDEVGILVHGQLVKALLDLHESQITFGSGPMLFQCLRARFFV